MPNYFQFNRPGEREPTELVEVEREFLTELGLAHEIHERRWHDLFDAVQWHVSMYGNDPEKLEAMFVRVRKLEENRTPGYQPIPERWYSLVKEFVLGPRFEASGWYNPAKS